MPRHRVQKPVPMSGDLLRHCGDERGHGERNERYRGREYEDALYGTQAVHGDPPLTKANKREDGESSCRAYS